MVKNFNIKDQLAGIAALIAAIVAIGGGFVKYGEITTKLDAIEAREQVVIDTSVIESGIAVLQEKVKELRKKISGQNLLEGVEDLRKKFKFRPKVKVVDTGSKSGTTGSGYKFYAGGGKAIKGLGRAFQKGGKV